MFTYRIETFGKANRFDRRQAIEILKAINISGSNRLSNGERIVKVSAIKTSGFERYANNERLDNGEAIPYYAKHGYSHWYASRRTTSLDYLAEKATFKARRTLKSNGAFSGIASL